MQFSLSVQKADHAAKLYPKAGFEFVRENEEEYITLNYLKIRERTFHL